ncbi:hypothetical protein PB2503_09694 [Parvularcula bermudensis HTCC2503]|uniref:Penicillin-binding protein n=1 Tax=Parvularcula bermudensis (strain ATCC BAA-594 / HTCC2503 / KCTC 12087) TaxID=314260 RepID=E0TDS5_PARBH|nr:penicillin-binding protein 2 [Parvularcula bermudensis]ADM09991.1 hypothetical protein PB2503_09694 [Parvularcula bermudensis HTCC2503]
MSEPISPEADVTFRLKLCAVAFFGLFGLLLLRLGMVSFGGEVSLRYDQDARAEIRAPRAIVDRVGRPLAMNTNLIGLAVDGREVTDPEEIAARLLPLFPDLDTARLTSRLARGRYVHLFNAITDKERQAVIALGLPGVRFPESQGRAYPQKSLAAHIVGYRIPGEGGAVGAEKALDAGSLSPGGREPVALSIDLVAQQILEEELARALETFSGKAAWGVLLDVHTGQVRALANLPTFNPNRPGAFPAASWRNRAMSDRYELGSAFKPLTVAAAFDAGVIAPSETFDVATPLEIGGWEIDDYSRKKPFMTPAEIVQYSSNIGTIRIVQRLGTARFTQMLEALNLSSPLFTELPEARDPALSTEWRPSELASSSYGHGIAVSPLQLTAAFAAVVNGGVYRTPTFLNEATVPGRRIFRPETSKRMKLILRRTVTDGTARNARAPGYYPIGKTATADKPVAGGYRDEGGQLISSFIGAFPGYDPQYVLLVSVDEPKGTRETYGFATAGYVAAPAFSRIVERVAPTLDIMPASDAVAADGFLGLRREIAQRPAETDALARLMEEALR